MMLNVEGSKLRDTLLENIGYLTKYSIPGKETWTWDVDERAHL